MFPRLFHIGNFNLPTYGFLVSLGVLIGLWISVRNSEKLGINGDDAWNLGIVVVLCGIVGAKILYIVNDWSTYAAHPGDIFTLNTLQAGGVFSGGSDRRICGGSLVRAPAPYASARDLRCVYARTRSGARHRETRLFCRWLLLGETHSLFLGGDV